MSIWDEFGEMVDELFDEFELPSIKIERTTTVQTKADKAAGRKGTANTVTTFGKGKQSKREVTLANGVVEQESIILINKPVGVGDKLTLGKLSFTVKSVESNDPIGMGAYTYLAVVG